MGAWKPWEKLKDTGTKELCLYLYFDKNAQTILRAKNIGRYLDAKPLE